MYKIFTDGAYSSTRNQGGIAFVITQEDKSIFEYSKTFQNTTNNRMEMLACIVALESIQEPDEVTLVSDSQYVVKTYTDNWKRKKNNDLWDRFDKAIKRHKSVKFEWVRGHNGNPFNEKTDRLAVRASQTDYPEMKPTVYDVGYLGIGKYSRQTHPNSYECWKSMLRRCYFKDSETTYELAEVSDEWKNFQNFTKWYINNYKEKWQLDKDILIKNNKLYSKDTACFVPKEINMLLCKTNALRGNLPIGVYEQRGKYVANLKINGKSTRLGTFTTPEEAFEAYKKRKKEYIVEKANIYKEELNPLVYNALLNYEIDVLD